MCKRAPTPLPGCSENVQTALPAALCRGKTLRIGAKLPLAMIGTHAKSGTGKRSIVLDLHLWSRIKVPRMQTGTSLIGVVACEVDINQPQQVKLVTIGTAVLFWLQALPTTRHSWYQQCKNLYSATVPVVIPLSNLVLKLLSSGGSADLQAIFRIGGPQQTRSTWSNGVRD
eukprot:3086252-Amphidinium_carterae.2